MQNFDAHAIALLYLVFIARPVGAVIADIPLGRHRGSREVPSPAYRPRFAGRGQRRPYNRSMPLES